MAELVDASDLKSLGAIRPGSTPGVPTNRWTDAPSRRTSGLNHILRQLVKLKQLKREQGACRFDPGRPHHLKDSISGTPFPSPFWDVPYWKLERPAIAAARAGS
jgi:hypothetical protein